MKLLHIDNPLENDPSVDNATKEAILSLKNDPLVYPDLSALSLTKAEVRSKLATLLEYQDDVHACASCPGLEHCPKARSGYRMSLSRERGRLHQNFYPCQLKQNYDKDVAKYSKRDFPEEWLGLDLRAIERSVSTRNPVLKAMVPIIKRDSDRWVYIYGDKKSGKSFMLACFANQIARIEEGVAFIDTRATFDELKEQSLKEKGKFARNMELLSSCPLLVFDNFGEEYKSRYVFETILLPLLQARAEQGLLTAFASPRNLEENFYYYRKKVDDEAVDQVLALIKSKTKKEFDVSGIPLYR